MPQATATSSRPILLHGDAATVTECIERWWGDQTWSEYSDSTRENNERFRRLFQPRIGDTRLRNLDVTMIAQALLGVPEASRWEAWGWLAKVVTYAAATGLVEKEEATWIRRWAQRREDEYRRGLENSFTAVYGNKRRSLVLPGLRDAGHYRAAYLAYALATTALPVGAVRLAKQQAVTELPSGNLLLAPEKTRRRAVIAHPEAKDVIRTAVERAAVRRFNWICRRDVRSRKPLPHSTLIARLRRVERKACGGRFAAGVAFEAMRAQAEQTLRWEIQRAQQDDPRLSYDLFYLQEEGSVEVLEALAERHARVCSGPGVTPPS